MATELDKFAWPGGYTLLYVFTQSREHLVLCWECATKAVKGIEQGDENYDGYSKEGSYINWEGESSWCDDCGVELPSEYGDLPKQDARSKIEEILRSMPESDLLRYAKELGIQETELPPRRLTEKDFPEPQVDAGELACEKTPTMDLEPDDVDPYLYRLHQ